MGRYPPPRLLTARREAPHRCGTTQEGMSPPARMETKLCRALLLLLLLLLLLFLAPPTNNKII